MATSPSLMDQDVAMSDRRVGVACAKYTQDNGRRAHIVRPVRSRHSCVLEPQVTRLGPEQSLEMKTLLLTIMLLGLVAALQAQDPLTFPLEELNITGTWYVKAFVVNKHLLPEWKGPRKVLPMTVTALEDGTWQATTTLLMRGRCLEKTVTLQKTEEPGRYSVSTDHGKRLVYIEELPEPDHYVFYCGSQDPGKTFRIGKLMGRSPEANLEALEEFREFAQHKGLLAQDIITPEQTDTCVPEHD